MKALLPIYEGKLKGVKGNEMNRILEDDLVLLHNDFGTHSLTRFRRLAEIIRVK